MVRACFFALFCIWVSGAPSHCKAGRLTVIEPDDFSELQVLNDVSPRVELRVYDGFIRRDFPEDFGVFPHPTVIPVTAVTNADVLGGFFTSTGVKSFGHAGVNFSPESRQLAARFVGAARSVSIDVVGTSGLSPVVGVLEVFDEQGNLLESVVTPELGRQQVATLSIARPDFDIGFARAFSSPDFSPFGVLDNLRFVSVPEPSAATLLAPAAAFLGRPRRRPPPRSNRTRRRPPQDHRDRAVEAILE